MKLLWFLLLIFSSLTHAANYELGAGTRYTDFYYKEILAAPFKSTESAKFAALFVEGKYYFYPRVFFQLSYEQANSVNSNYDGTDVNTGAPVQAGNPLKFTTYEGEFSAAVMPELSIYLGYGMRKWDRFLTGSPGYREIYSWNIVSLGAQYRFSNGPVFEYGLDACIRAASGGKIKVITSQTYTNGQDSTMSLGAKNGYRISAPIIWHLSWANLSATPFYEISHIGHSEVVTNTTLEPRAGYGIEEPDSDTTQKGVELLLAIPF